MRKGKGRRRGKNRMDLCHWKSHFLVLLYPALIWAWSICLTRQSGLLVWNIETTKQRNGIFSTGMETCNWSPALPGTLVCESWMVWLLSAPQWFVKGCSQTFVLLTKPRWISIWIPLGFTDLSVLKDILPPDDVFVGWVCNFEVRVNTSVVRNWPSFSPS